MGSGKPEEQGTTGDVLCIENGGVRELEAQGVTHDA